MAAPRTKKPISDTHPLLKRLGAFWVRHRRLFWTLHSIWALCTGVVVILLARERYGFVPWVILFLAATWASTLFFGKSAATRPEGVGPRKVPGLKKEATSYLTRVMYQETLFFMLPFYWYSTVVKSLNVLFSALLLSLAVFSCVDLVFDRWLRSKPLFGLLFFATVAFAAVNLLLPMLLPVGPSLATPVSAAVALGSAIPIAFRGSIRKFREWLWFGGASVVFLVLAIAVPRLVPAVPLRVQNTTFSSEFDRKAMAPLRPVVDEVKADELGGTIFVLAEVFAPSILPTSVNLEWKRNGNVFRTTRDIEIKAHDLGFRVWDGYRAESGSIAPGDYEIIFRAKGDRVFGRASITVAP